ncbi:hypothetical protein ACFYKX_11530 [Cytobacillus sp. FJAT-54145]|uniref:Uncharacterized protein n=1 Tax=Cytobacillus spartinae TaxID=3299023 RepID=A0ABW6KCC0_9BACI
MNQAIHGISIKSISYLETSRGVAYTAPLLLDGKEVGTIENQGNGGATMIRMNHEAQEEFQSRMNTYFAEQNLETDEEVFAEHLIDVHEFGRVLTEEEKEVILNEGL